MQTEFDGREQFSLLLQTINEHLTGKYKPPDCFQISRILSFAHCNNTEAPMGQDPHFKKVEIKTQVG